MEFGKIQMNNLMNWPKRKEMIKTNRTEFKTTNIIAKR
jgi:hypothetical protein